MRRERLLNLSAALLPRPRFHDRVSQEAADALAELFRAARRLRLPERPVDRMGTVLRHVDYLAVAAARKLTGRDELVRSYLQGPDIVRGSGWTALPDKPRRYTHFAVVLHTEQAPDPENRITLDAERRDALGNPLPRLHFEWREADRSSARRGTALLAHELARAGLGRLEPDGQDGDIVLLSAGCCHHMGTTRMDPDPKRGVVDTDGQVHGTANLYVAGSSVFPTGGQINPSLTIAAMAFRLADHLRQRLD